MKVDTARPTAGTQLEWLNDSQLAAVRKIRQLAGTQNASPYTIGLFCARSDRLHTLKDAKRLAFLTPSTRERLISDFRDELAPYEPTVVAVWSAWCDQHDVDPFAEPQDWRERPDVLGPATEPTPTPKRPRTRTGEPLKPVASRGAPVREAAKAILREALADGQEHDFSEIKKLGDFTPVMWRSAAEELGVKRRVVYSGFGVGKQSFWSWPKAPNPQPELVDPPRRHGDVVTGVVVGSDDDDIVVPLRKIHTASNPVMAAKAEKAMRRMRRLARRTGVTVQWLARWAEMAEGVHLRQRRTSKSLPDRESDEGIELADEVLRGCMPFSPQAISTRIGRADRGWPKR